MTPRTGRPPTDNPRDQVRTIRLTRDELITVKTAAARAGTPLSTWLRQAVLNASSQPQRRPK